MPRRKNPLMTFVIFLVVVGFGWASYHFLFEERIFARADKPPPPPDQIQRLKASIEGALGGDGCFISVMDVNWRPRAGIYRVDVQMPDGCEKKEAQRLSERVVDLVRAGTGGGETEVWLYALTREIYHRLP